jgi:hypothetical protein
MKTEAEEFLGCRDTASPTPQPPGIKARASGRSGLLSDACISEMTVGISLVPAVIGVLYLCGCKRLLGPLADLWLRLLLVVPVLPVVALVFAIRSFRRADPRTTRRRSLVDLCLASAVLLVVLAVVLGTFLGLLVIGMALG